MKTRRIITDRRASYGIIVACWLVYMIAYLTRNTYPASIVHLTDGGLLTPSDAGLVSTVYFVCYSCGHLINGFLADRVSPLAMLFIGIGGTAAANLLMPLTIPTVPAMIAVWAANGYFESMLWAPIVAIQSGMIAPSLRYRAMELISFSSPIGMITAYLLTALCTHFGGGIILTYRIAAVLALMTAVLLAAVSRHAFKTAEEAVTMSAEKTQERKDHPPLLKLLVTGGAIVFTVPVVFHGMLKDGVNTWVPSILRDTFRTPTSLSTALAILLPLSGLAGVAFANFLLRWKRLGHNHPRIGIRVMLLMAIPLALLLQMKTLTLIGGLLCLCLIAMLISTNGHVFAVMMPTEFAVYGKASTVSGIFNTLIYAGSAISTYTFGVIAERAGWGVTIAVWLGLALGSAVILTFAVKPWRAFLQNKPQ